MELSAPDRLWLVSNLMIDNRTLPPGQLFNTLFCLSVDCRMNFDSESPFLRRLKTYLQGFEEKDLPCHERFIQLGAKLLPLPLVRALMKIDGLAWILTNPVPTLVLHRPAGLQNCLCYVIDRHVRVDMILKLHDAFASRESTSHMCEIPRESSCECGIEVMLILIIIHSAWIGDLRWYDVAVRTSDRLEGRCAWTSLLICAEDVSLYRAAFTHRVPHNYTDVYHRIQHGDDPVVMRWNEFIERKISI